jgi:Protein of unknown function (DUF2889)
MSTTDTASTASTGYRRRIELYPSPGTVSAGLEDDFHRFTMRVDYSDGIITAVDARVERFPWSTCTDAGAFLAQQAVGRKLQEVAALDVLTHCTHLYEMVVMCAAHAADSAPTRFDLWVPDRVNDRTHATLSENGDVIISWDMNGWLIEGSPEWAGKDLLQLSKWRKTLDRTWAERANLLRRAIVVSHGRKPPEELPKRADDPRRVGACFTYTLPRGHDAIRRHDLRRDFSDSADGPLQNYHPEIRPAS